MKIPFPSLKPKFFSSLILATLLNLQAFPQSIGNGSDGSVSISGIVNSYAAVLDIIDTSATSTNFRVDTTSFFKKNDLVLVIQMQGASINTADSSTYGSITNYNNAGNYEYVKVLNVTSGNVITTKIQKSYTVNGVVQLVRVPQYITATINDTLIGLPWNGSKGGVIAIDAQTKVIQNAEINADYIGFRPGTLKNDATISTDITNYLGTYSDLMGMKGEGIAYYGDTSGVNIYGRGAPANGGGGGDNHNAGGGGGSNIGCGGLGGYGFYSYVQPKADGVGGYPLTFINDAYNKVFMGGGGGAGQENDNEASKPGLGGGIVIITTNNLLGNKYTIDANGQDGQMAGIDGSAGAGGGGSVLIYTDTMSNVSVSCAGGKGGDATVFSGWHLTAPGGGGGGGLLWVKTSSTALTYNVDGGNAGICDTSNFGATSGCIGTLKTNLAIITPKTTGIQSISGNNIIVSIYPNPTDDYIYIKAPGIFSARLNIYDETGREIYQAPFTGNILKVDVQSFAAGIYFLKLNNEETTYITRIIKK